MRTANERETMFYDMILSPVLWSEVSDVDLATSDSIPTYLLLDRLQGRELDHNSLAR